jgi:hypothetical protein
VVSRRVVIVAEVGDGVGHTILVTEVVVFKTFHMS